MTEHSLKLSYPATDTALLSLKGDWTLGRAQIEWESLRQELEGRDDLREIRLDSQALGEWDSRLLTLLQNLSDFVADRQIALDISTLPDGARRLLKLARAVPEREGASRRQGGDSILHRLGAYALNAWNELLIFNTFVGELALSTGRLLVGRASFRGIDFVRFLQSAGPDALPIVSLIGVLVGAVLAFVGAVQLQMFGAEIYVANLVGLGSVREMGAMMTAIIMAGRTGSAYAAQLGTMQVNDEIDALKTFGISVMDFLVLPRTLALVLMLPLLTIWADVLAIIGGMLVGVLVLDITFLEYLIQTQESMDLGDVAVGLVKSLIFAVVIAMAGCLRGLQSGKNSSAVGNATTSATVTAILLIVVWDAITTILFNQLGI
ncbi:MAG: ABC transporter permease [Candidatus Thiodiazotropha sp. (ex Monitilora ramsayi)]|nr:ABC transporter permease [Candidatus Thiodiazotropha sp. (ex Monitilora ramsayi)]